MISTGADDRLPGRIIREYVLEWCGFETRVFQLMNARKLDDARKQEIQENVRKAVRFLKKKPVSEQQAGGAPQAGRPQPASPASSSAAQQNQAV